jgi:hypothetical protein
MLIFSNEFTMEFIVEGATTSTQDNNKRESYQKLHL